MHNTSLIPIITIAWSVSAVLGVYIILIYIFKREKSSYKLGIASLSGLVVSSCFLVLSILGSIHKISPCDFGSEDIIMAIFVTLLFAVPIAFSRDRRAVIKNISLQWIVFFAINWGYW